MMEQAQRGPQNSNPLRPNALYSSCGSFPNTVLNEDASTSLFRDLSSALAGLPESNFHADGLLPLDDELQIEPLSLDGLNMLRDPSVGLPDPSVEETFRSDRL